MAGDKPPSRGAKTNRERFLVKHDLPKDTSLSLREIEDLSGVPFAALKRVYNRGLGAYKSNPQSVRMKGTFKKGVNAPMSMKLSPQQWGMGRVYAFVQKTPKVFGKADRDIAEDYGLL
jgi:hypothetical protein